MSYEELAERLLVAPHLIACIHEEETGDKYGITILYNDGASFSKPLGSKEKQAEVWEKLLKLRPNSLTEFADILFDPKDVQCVNLTQGEDGEAVLIIEFVNHEMYNDIRFRSNDYANFARACVELYDHLDDEQYRRSNVFFISRAFH